VKKNAIRLVIAAICIGATAIVGWVAFDLLFGKKPVMEGTLLESIPPPWNNVVGTILLLGVLVAMGIISVRVIKKAFSIQSPQGLF
jgi:hypothetical protein